FIAYTKLAAIKGLREQLQNNGTFDLYRNGTLKWNGTTPMLWNDRSFVILTYSISGFANFGSVGQILALLSTMALDRKGTFTKIALRTLIAANMVSLMGACIAGLLYDPARK
ncbi:unnamed protein product, partial [Didymodactylos carnosus]